MHQMNSRDKKSVKSNFESNIILGKVRQLLNGKGLEQIENGMTALLSGYKITSRILLDQVRGPTFRLLPYNK